MTELMRPDGLLLVDKPEGISSFGVIERLQRALQAKTGVKKRELPSFGHGGTLDPFATGLILLCVGRGVKLSRYFLESGFKTYEAELKFGEKTASGDRTNPVTETSSVIPSDVSAMREAAASFVRAPYLQTPPMYSAKKIDGKPLYELARKGVEIERAARECTVKSFDILETQNSAVRFSVMASSGTFIRTLAEDFAKKLGTVAHLTSLRRTKSGPYTIENALSLDEWAKQAEEGQDWSKSPGFVKINHMLDHFPILEVNETERSWLRHGLQASIPDVLIKLDSPRFLGETRAAFKWGEELVGIAVRGPNQWELERIVPLSESV